MLAHWKWKDGEDMVATLVAHKTSDPSLLSNSWFTKGGNHRPPYWLSNRQWNTELIDGIFIPSEVDLIKNIPLSRTESEDMIYWPLTQNGQYTCKNEYDEASQDMYSPQDSSFWKGVWSLQVPNKVKNLMWRACKNSIPTKLNLLRWAIIVDPLCDRCKSEAQSPLHALWLCNELDPV